MARWFGFLDPVIEAVPGNLGGNVNHWRSEIKDDPRQFSPAHCPQCKRPAIGSLHTGSVRFIHKPRTCNDRSLFSRSGMDMTHFRTCSFSLADRDGAGQSERRMDDRTSGSGSPWIRPGPGMNEQGCHRWITRSSVEVLSPAVRCTMYTPLAISLGSSILVLM